MLVQTYKRLACMEKWQLDKIEIRR